MANRFKKAAEGRRDSVVLDFPKPEQATKPEPIKPAESKREETAPRQIDLGSKPAAKTEKREEESLVGVSMRIPVAMRDALRLRYARTGENTTTYLKRLIEEDMRNNPF